MTHTKQTAATEKPQRNERTGHTTRLETSSKDKTP